MPAQRKRFRIEELAHGCITLPEVAEPMPMQDDVITELRAIRNAMASPHVPNVDTGVPLDIIDAQTTMESYRAQIAQCEKLKIELDLIHDAIGRTKREIATIHGKTFDGGELAIVNCELGAIVGGTEKATQKILEAAEMIDQATSAIMKVNSPDQQKALCDDIGDSVVAIFEACNFQDLTGQRIARVMTTMSFVENHINVMMEIWGGVDAIKAHAPAPLDERDDDAKLLNGPKGEDDAGHVSQDDIDALFN